ncbi:MAG: [acyl-carrier-] S-malonyltransferase protein [Candidatus Xenolissoclinum pacificiensis L6]|uniref:Malonyl CoA-acyl carrier protein transacylase n=1 Tax=Candidatus Xenolissoclinum pacificiensis L6 TaxID=1401685 RepID=W2UZU6_9RICK|nr:MAG: [acyl-carrier-] S-malonyltransferase protein [Candidatus Xenolissoclinum pacificiensis L6]
MKNVLLFPGQGSQIVSMGYDFAKEYLEAREVFEEVDEVLHYNLSNLIFHGSEQELTKTQHVQPALMAVSIAILRTIQKKLGVSDDVRDIANFVAGHSLGEYTALCAAGSLSLSEAARLLHIRGIAMSKAIPENTGGMMAVITNDNTLLHNIINELDAKIYVANDNGAGQIVLSALHKDLDRFVECASKYGIKKCIRLKASAPFHSGYMLGVKEIMKEAFKGVKLYTPSVPIISNVSAKPEQDPGTLVPLLCEQVIAPVRWRESVSYLHTQEVTGYIEIGSSKVLTKLNSRMLNTGSFLNVGKLSDIANVLQFFEKCLEQA